jgi:hypothetical protein
MAHKKKMAIGVLAVLAAVSSVTHAQTTGVLSREQLQALIDESAKALKNLITARDQAPPPALAFKRDKRGKSLIDDLKHNVVPTELQKKLEALLKSARSDLHAGDLPGVQVELTDLRRSLKTEIEDYQAISEYWRESASNPFVDGAGRKTTLQTLGVETPNRDQIETLSAQLDQQIAAGEFVAAMRTTWPKLNELQKQAKSAEYQQLLAKVDSDALQSVRSASPTRKCSSANGTTSKTDTPTVRPDFPPTNEYFPPSLKKRGIRVGSPEVFVVVNADGCPERAVVVGPTEHEEFDEAGLRMAVDGRYFPAEKDGKAVRAGFYLRLNFFTF